MYKNIVLATALLLPIFSFAQGRSAQHVESLEYPRLAVVAKIQGAVKVVIVLDSEGRVRSAEAISGPAILKDAAKENIMKWRFDVGSEQELSVTYQFQLKEVPESQTPHSENKFDLPDTVTVLSDRHASGCAYTSQTSKKQAKKPKVMVSERKDDDLVLAQP